MCNLGVWLTLIMSAYIFVIIVISVKENGGPEFWVKVIFWPITVIVYFLGLLLWILVWVPRKLFQGILFCLYEIKDFFVNVLCSAIEDEN